MLPDFFRFAALCAWTVVGDGHLIAYGAVAGVAGTATAFAVSRLWLRLWNRSLALRWHIGPLAALSGALTCTYIFLLLALSAAGAAAVEVADRWWATSERSQRLSRLALSEVLPNLYDDRMPEEGVVVTVVRGSVEDDARVASTYASLTIADFRSSHPFVGAIPATQQEGIRRAVERDVTSYFAAHSHERRAEYPLRVALHNAVGGLKQSLGAGADALRLRARILLTLIYIAVQVVLLAAIAGAALLHIRLHVRESEVTD
jgi:hypothetical protein